jgi:hypothetical protein
MLDSVIALDLQEIFAEMDKKGLQALLWRISEDFDATISVWMKWNGFKDLVPVK